MRPLPTAPILWDWQSSHFPEKDPAVCRTCQRVQKAEKRAYERRTSLPEAVPVLKDVMGKTERNSILRQRPRNTGLVPPFYAVKPGDGSAREQAASCQKVLGGWANIAKEYATKRYRSNTGEQENTAENTAMTAKKTGRVVCWYLLPDGICEAVPVNRHCLPSGNIRCVIFLIYYSRPGTALCGTGCRKTDGVAARRKPAAMATPASDVFQSGDVP